MHEPIYSNFLRFLAAMLGEYHVSRCTRNCHALHRPLREGEWYYSVVMESGDDYVRRDFSAESWKGPPEEAIGWWKCRMPSASEKKLVLAPPEVLIDLLRQMSSFPDKAKTRYLLAIMLMRKRLVRPWEGTPDDSLSEGMMRLEVLADSSTIDVMPCEITRAEADPLRDELNDLLYCEADVVSADDEPSTV